ncbi:MAG: MATE family efflux transporter [Acutalibacteraceae bacterium]
MEKSRSGKMGSAPMFKLIMSMSLPSMFSMIIQALYNVVDSMFVAMVSTDALTAVSIAFPIQMLIISTAVGTGIGINSLVSRKLGEGNREEADSAATHGIVLGIFSWIVFMIVGFTVVNPFFSAYTSDVAIFNMGTQYLSCCMFFSFGVFIELNIEKALQATGNMVFPMLFMLSGAVTNIILDPMFIFGIGFFPKLGVLGAAVATVIGQIVSMIFAVIVIFKTKQDVKVHFKGFKLSGKTIKNIYAVGVPSIIMQSICSVMLLGMNAILIVFSNTAVSVLGVYYKLQSLIFMPVFGLTHGVMPIMGYNYGAKNKKRLLSALKYGTLIAAVIMAVGTAVFMLFPGELLKLFSATDEMLKIGEKALRIISLNFIPAAIGIMITSMFQAIGKGIRSMFISFMRQLVILLPAAYLLSFIGLDEVWLAFPISEAVSLVLAIVIFIQLLRTDLKRLSGTLPVAVNDSASD